MKESDSIRKQSQTGGWTGRSAGHSRMEFKNSQNEEILTYV